MTSQGVPGDKRDIWGRKLKRGPEPLSAFLDSFLSKVTTPGGSVMVQLAGDWDQVAGRDWAGKSRPVGLRNGVLTVEVPDGATASLMRFQLAALQQRLNGRFGEGVVAEVTLRVRRHEGRGPAPRSHAEGA